MATLTPTTITSAGVKQTLGAATACGDRFKPVTGHEFIRFYNGSASTVTVTIPAVLPGGAAKVNSVLTGNAASAQAVVNVTDGTKFSAGMRCTLADTAGRETLTVLSVLANAVTMTTNLVNSYTTAHAATLWVGGADIVLSLLAIGSAPANDKTIAFDGTALTSDFTDDDGWINITYSSVTTVTVGVFTN